MKIAVVAANGKAGRLIVEEAVKRGNDVTAIARSANKTKAQKFIQKDILDLTKADLQGFDVVIDAFGAWTPETLPGHSTTQKHLTELLADTPTRLLIVGGAGGLYTDETRTTQVVNTPTFPKEYFPVSSAMTKAFNAYLKGNKKVHWTFVTPAFDFRADGERKGSYLLHGDVAAMNDKGESIISYADYALAMVDLAEKGGHDQEMVSVLWK